MKFGLFDKSSALNSGPVWRALQQGLDQLGLKYRSHDEQADVAIIWSQVWAGRMRDNLEIWKKFRNTHRPVLVAEVGMLHRGVTWKLGINGTNRNAKWGQGFDPNRPSVLGLDPKPWSHCGTNIVICLQRQDSEQWHGQPPMTKWLEQTLAQIRKVSDRPILVRCHPRQSLSLPRDIAVSTPRALVNSYDSFDFETAIKEAWAVVNWNSGCGSQAILSGIPAFVGESSLAAPVANLDLRDMESPRRPDRQDWLREISHSEWTLDELATGWPLERLLDDLKSF